MFTELKESGLVPLTELQRTTVVERFIPHSILSPQENDYIAKYPTLLIKYYIAVYPPQIVRIWFEFYYFLKISGVSKMGDNELYSKISPIANEYKHFLALFVWLLYGRI